VIDLRKLDQVYTLSEVSRILNIAPTTLRSRLANNNIPQKYYRKTEEGVYLFSREYVENEKKIS
jgi:hypothetical protein